MKQFNPPTNSLLSEQFNSKSITASQNILNTGNLLKQKIYYLYLNGGNEPVKKVGKIYILSGKTINKADMELFIKIHKPNI